MRILHFSTSDSHGGAAKYAYHLHELFCNHGCESQLVVSKKGTADPNVIQAEHPRLKKTFYRALKHFPLVGEEKTKFTFNQDREYGVSLQRVLAAQDGKVDIIFIHWVSTFLTTKSINRMARRFDVPIVWLALDQELTTGGCHYSFECEGYKNQCGNCPLLYHPGSNDLSHQVWKCKEKYLGPLDITFVAATSWSFKKTQESSLARNHRIEMIPLPISDTIFTAMDRRQARSELNLPSDVRIILFGASYIKEPRKGAKQFIEALHKLAARWQEAGNQLDSLHLAIIGQQGEELAAASPIRYTLLGQQKTDCELARTYSAADVFACSSLYDAGPMMVAESLICGTPVVAFEMGMVPDIVASSDKTGYVAQLGDSDDFARGLFETLLRADNPDVRKICREKAIAHNGHQSVSEKYLKLFADLRSGKK